MRSFMGAAGRVSLSVLLALALCPALSLEAFAGEEPIRGEVPQEETAVQTDPSPMNQDAASSTEDESASPKADSPYSQQPIADPAEPSSASEPTPAASAISMAEEDLDWQPCGTCEWAIDSSKTLIVRPANGAESGELEDWDGVSFSPWEGTAITSARFEGAIIAPSCQGMFSWCTELVSVDLSGLDTSHASSMAYMFDNCTFLSSLDLSALDTAKVKSMYSMFHGCSSLDFVDLSLNDIDSVVDVSRMFDGCTDLISLNLSNLNSSNIQNDSYFINRCDKLASVTVGSQFSFETMKGGLPGQYWKSSIDGVAYESSNMPANVAATYEQFPSKQTCQAYRSGTCEWIVDSNGVLRVYPANDLQMGELAKWDYESDSPWRGMSFVSAMFDEGVKAATCVGMFSFCDSLQYVDLSKLDTSNATNMDSMFSGCSSLVSVDVSKLATANIESMSYMFNGCSSLETIDLTDLDLSKLTNMSCMFSECRALDTVEIAGLDLSSVVNASSLFSGCQNLKTLDLSEHDLSNVKYLSAMLSDCISLKEVDLSDIDTSGLLRMSGMFKGCRSLTALNLSDLDTSYVTDASDMFFGCTSLESVTVAESFPFDLTGGLPGSYWVSTTGRVAFEGSNMPSGIAATYVPIEPGALDQVYRCGSCEWIIDSDWNLSVRPANGADVGELPEWGFATGEFSPWAGLPIVSARFEGMVSSPSLFGAFMRCSALVSIDLSNLDTSNTIDMSLMFNSCGAIEYLDVSSLDTSSVQDMSQMFAGCASLRSLDLSHFDTSNVSRMPEMFIACESLELLDLSGFKTSNVKDMSRMFQGCNSLKSLDLSSFDTSKASSRREMMDFSCGENFIITLGEDFSFENSVSNRVCGMPKIKASDYPDRKVTGKWIDVDTGAVYGDEEVPSKHVATYMPEVLWQLAGKADASGNPCKAVELIAKVSLDDSCAALNPSLFYQWLDAKTGMPTGPKTESPVFDAAGEFEGSSLYCEVTADPAVFYGAIRSEPILVSHNVGEELFSNGRAHWHICKDCRSEIKNQDHSFGAWSVIQSPTCAEPGSESRSCSACGYAQTRSVPASGHSYGDAWSSDPSGHWRACAVCGAEEEAAAHELGAWTATMPATCEEAGAESRACATCGYEESRAVPPLGHTAAQGWISDALGHWHACLECGTALDEEGHSFGAWSVIESPTCAEPGSESHHCSACGYAETRSVPAAGHSYGDAWSSGPSGHWRVCAVCGAEEDASAHEFGKWTVTTPATCTSFGQKERVCPVCDFREIGDISPTGHGILEGWRSDGIFHWKVCSKCDERLNLDAHSFGDWQIDEPPTCTEAGEESQTCAVCGYKAIDPVEPTGHAWGPLLSDKSSHWRECSSCSMKGPASDHSFGEWTTVLDPTVDEPGSEERCCSECGYHEQREIPAVEPSNPFADVIKDSTPHYDHILWLAHEGISEGWDAGNGGRVFRPYADVTRADMAAFLYRLAGSPAYEVTNTDMAAFSDADASTPHLKEVCWLASTGISTGFPDGTFRPYESIARIDMAAFLHRLAGWMGAPEPEGAGKSFPDVTTGMAHAEDVAWLSAAGITTGFPDGTFRPYDSIVRCDMAAFLHRLDGFVGGYEVD